MGDQADPFSKITTTKHYENGNAALYLLLACASLHTERMEKLLTPADLAQKVGLAVQTIYNRRATGGSLPRSILIGQFVRFHPRDVEAWLTLQYEDQLVDDETRLIVPVVTKRRGRPTKAEQVRRRCQKS